MARPVHPATTNRGPGRVPPGAWVALKPSAYSRMNGSLWMIEATWPFALNREAVYW